MKSCYSDEEDIVPPSTEAAEAGLTRDTEDQSDEDSDFVWPMMIPAFLKPDNGPDQVCDLMKDPGPCHPLDPARFLRRYFYNITTRQCEMFLYGGCGGNHNNFENSSDCETFCAPYNKSAIDTATLDTKTEDTWNVSSCTVSPRHGNCHALEPRWFFSHWDNVCKPYNYSGCGANINSFRSEEECQTKCPPLNFDGAESRCMKLRRRGDCAEKVERYFFDMFTEKCVKFGGCDDLGENENNFETKASCLQTCLSPRFLYKI